jgi:hypothetical protein
VKKGTKEWNYLKESEIVIIDETPILAKNVLEIIDEKFKEIMETNHLFGGKILLMGGDFRQTLPIMKYATKSQLLDLSVKKSLFWNKFKKFKLTKNMRVNPEEKEFAEFLLQLGEGKLNDADDYVTLPAHCVRYEDLVEKIFGNVIDLKDFKEICKRAILAPLNVDVDEINDKVLIRMPGEEKVYKSVDSMENDSNNQHLYPDEYLNSLNPTSLPRHELRLKENSVIMLIRNMNVKAGLSNGTRLKVLKMHERILECEILTGDKIGDKVLLPRITLYEDEIYPFILSRHQFPVKVSFGLTINKAQGQTFEKIGLDLRTEVFQHGQLYVAFSRTRSWNGVVVRLKKDNVERKVKNIVYKEIFED